MAKYSPEMVDKICKLIAEGNSVQRIGEMDEMPNRTTIFGWLFNKPEFYERYQKAKDAQADTYEDQIIELADLCDRDSDAVQKAKLQIYARQWVMGKNKPKKYGDNMTIKGDKDNPLILNLASALDSAIAQRLNAIKTIDHAPHTVQLPVIDVHDSVSRDEP